MGVDPSSMGVDLGSMWNKLGVNPGSMVGEPRLHCGGIWTPRGTNQG